MKSTRLSNIINRISKGKWFLQVGAILLIMITFFILAFPNVYTQTYDMEKFSTTKETIRAPITIENEKETERRTREVVQSIEERYQISTEITEERIGFVEEIFEAVKKIKEDNLNSTEEGVNTESELDQLKQILSPEINNADITNKQWRILLDSTDNERTLAQELITTSLYEAFDNGVRSEEQSNVIRDINQKLQYASINEELREVLFQIVNFAIVPNSFFSADLTNEAQKQATDNVEPVMIRAGEVIVQEGQLITNEIYEELELLGLLDSERNYFPVIGLIILFLLLASIIFIEFKEYEKIAKLDRAKMGAIVLVSLFVAIMLKMSSLYMTSTNHLHILVPIAAASLLVKILLSERIAIALSIVYSIIGSVLFNTEIPGLLNLEAGIYFLFSQLAGVYFLRNIKDRSAILKAASGVVLVNIATVLLFLFMTYEKYTWIEYLTYSGYGLLSALLAAILTLGMLPFFETGLGIISDTKLLTLSSPNQPLLRKLLVEAPGTYHHSIMVANLSEASCEAIGANGLLARVAAYYHDLGKTVRPHYFIENQMGMKNPHDYLEPAQSAEIIMAHPYDGARLLKEHKIPKEIIDIAKQHHGTTLLKYFYFKAKEKYNDTKERDYRYPGPKPKSKEAAIVAVCDSVEAAVRSMDHPSQKEISKLVSSIIEDRLLDGQLNESTLTFQELEQIKKVICETLNGIYHSRIKYPTEEKNKEDDRLDY
ncbi:HD family phosphohydrolase [Saliterribacillus persicus]|uniref:HD/PDEase domain-containing protein n=1 Tax=Saliterribacillus persicus TaxID=930114 RepID=A0A368XH43_9BACI|nr:HDIG domain-containing metalloprotein [Saliterribacillus persicus]RCW65334.1 hypothetical protein DFR57_11162 [Saliterribacillus persicus]